MARQPKMQYFAARGNFAFPWDMLRYDAAWPATEHDSGVIESSIRHEKGPHVVILKTYSLRITEGRWKSFLWDVSGLFADEYALEKAYSHWFNPKAA